MSIAAIVLAAGKASRFAPGNKLASCIAGTPIVRHVVNAVLESPAAPVVVVTGYWESGVRASLAGLPVLWRHNPEPDRGVSSSIQVGIASLGSDVKAAFICLGDMPYVRAPHLATLANAFVASNGNAICVPTFQGRRGNPVLWPAQWFVQLTHLRGDQGARSLLAGHLAYVRWVPVSDPGILVDIDNSEDLTSRKHLGFD